MSDSLSTVYKYQLTPNHVPTRSLAKQKYVTIGPNQEQVSTQFSFDCHLPLLPLWSQDTTAFTGVTKS